MTTDRPIQPVIMSGGAGTRLWPLSRAALPKQFLALTGDRTLFQETLLRLAPGPDADFLPPLVIAGAAHEGLVRAQADEIGAALAGVVLEPVARNTAAVAATAALWTKAAHERALVLLAPADHHVADATGFRRAIGAALGAADGAIVTFGVKPDRPHTGYGYIERGEALGGGVFKVAAFREKPDAATASAYLDGGRHYWNAGVFLFDPATMLAELERHAPEIARRATSALARAKGANGTLAPDAVEFAQIPFASIDCAVMEKTARARVAGPLEIGWSDVGAWSSIRRSTPESLVEISSGGNVVVSDGPFVGLVGVDDLIVVATKDAVLVVRKDRAEDVKKVVDMLKARARTDLL